MMESRVEEVVIFQEERIFTGFFAVTFTLPSIFKRKEMC
jgi:hypothetical protein